MRSADGRAGVLCLKLVKVDEKSVAREHVHHFSVALVAVAHYPVEHRGQLFRADVKIVSEHVYLSAVPAAAKLHPGDDFNAAFFSGLLCFGNAVYAVVIGHGDRAQAERPGIFHRFRRRFRAVGYICVNVKVNFSHCFIVSIIFSASS